MSTVDAARPGRCLVPSSSVVARRLRLYAALMLAAWCWIAGTGTAWAATSLPLTQWAHRAWHTQTGSPPEVVALAQTRDGFLWLGTGVGLFRFDGIRFEEFEAADGGRLPSLGISSLQATSDGGLLVGYRFGGISWIHGHRAVHFTAGDNVPAAAVYAFVEEADGVVWAASLGGLLRFDQGRWERVDRRWNYKGDRAYAVYIDVEGSLWVDDGTELMRLRRHERHFEAVGVQLDRSIIRGSPRGDLWILDSPHRLRVRSAAGEIRTIAGWTTYATPNGMLLNQDGELWVAGNDGGLFRLRNDDGSPGGERIERYAQQEGLKSGFTLSVLEDREGTYWVGSKVGLDQFRRQNVIPVPLPSGSTEISIVPANADGIWVGSRFAPIAKVGANGVESVAAIRDAVLGRVLTCGTRAPDGTIWFGGPGTVLRQVGASFSRIGIPTDVGTGDVQAMAVARDGALWISIARGGLFRWSNGTWERNGGLAAFPARGPQVAAADRDGRLWFGYSDHAIASLDGGQLLVFDERDGLTIGNVTAISARGRHRWFGGEHGVALWKNGRFVPVPTAEHLAAVSAIVETPNGDLWVAARRAIHRIDAADIDKLDHDPRHVAPTEAFDYTDGLPGVPVQFRPLPASVLADDGRLWVATGEGLAWIDPQHIIRNQVPPALAVEWLIAAGRGYRPDDAIRLPAGTRELSVRYTALSLVRPERVQFRYRLLGSSTHWSDDSSRREAFFTNLGPGRYRFEVTASNDSGVWNQRGEGLDFEIAPYFWQTDWFRVVCFLIAIALLYAFFVLRLTQVSRRVQQRLQERFAERERIARELHDTLLQSIQGLILQFYGLTRPGSPAVPHSVIERVLDEAQQVLVEGRDRVLGLRESSHPSEDLVSKLEECVAQIAGNWSVPCTLQVHGAPADVDPSVLDDLVIVAREALFNAFRHAGATAIQVDLTYRREDVALRITDDGCGIPPEILAAGEAAGHFGLPGMRERAARLKARLALWQAQPQGTIVELVVPAQVAYSKRGWFSSRVAAWSRKADARGPR